MKKISIICFFILVLSVLPVHSERSATVNYLMKEPLTMFEWGMYQLKQDIDQYFESLAEQNSIPGKSKKQTTASADFSDFYTNVNFVWGDNRINISIVLINEDKSLSVMSRQDLCRKYTESVKKHFFSTHERELRKEFGISKYFKHKYFSKNNKPENFIEEIENIVHIRIDIQYTKNVFLLKESDYKVVTSVSPLMDDYIIFNEPVDDKKESTD